MKYITIGLLAASLAASPAMASWRPAFFAKIDTDSNKVLTREELKCANPKMFSYSDKDNNNVLSYDEFFKNRYLLKLCK
jgi:hypothetical protein